jgi:hypothetical protein
MSDPNGKWRIPVRRYKADATGVGEIEFTEHERGEWCEASAVHRFATRLHRENERLRARVRDLESGRIVVARDVRWCEGVSDD